MFPIKFGSDLSFFAPLRMTFQENTRDDIPGLYSCLKILTVRGMLTKLF